MSDLQQNLFEAVESITSRQIDSTPIDLTITAEVALIRNIEVGEYKVTYKGDTFSAYSLDPMTVYKQGEEVYVLVPKGDFSSKKVILGKAAYNDSVSYADRQAMGNQWKTRGPNWLSNEWYWRNSGGSYRTDNNTRGAGIIATTEGEEILITGGNNEPPSWREYIFYRDADTNPDPDEPVLSTMRQNKITRPLPANRPSLASLQKVDEQFQVYADNFEHVMISANFETNFSSVHFSGEYGILVECWVENPKYGKENYPDEPERILTTLRFSFNDFNGAPYQFNQSTPQRAVFPVPKGTLKGLVRVALFQDDGWETDIIPHYITSPTPDVTFDPAKGATPVRDRNNIFVTNVDIRWCEGINLTDSLFWLKIDSPRGTSLYNSDGTIPGNVSIPLQARLFYGSEELTSRETCKFYWFRQKYSATMDKVDKDNDKDEFGRSWWDYGGNGWAPIEKIILPGTDPGDGSDWSEFFGEGANGVNQYRFEDDTWHQTLNVGIEVVPWQWRYKVVCVYNSVAENVEDKLNRPNTEVILFETELVTNEDSIHDFELPLPIVSDDLLTTFLRTRNNNLPWEEGVNYDPQNPDDPDPARDWWCRWWMETPSGLYEPVPHTGIPRFQKGKININDYLHYDAITFKAQIFGKKNPIGSTQEAQIADAAQVWPWPAGPDQSLEQNEYEIANIERTLLKSEDLLLLVDWEGITNHSYNSDGSILLQSSVGSEFSLRAILHWSDATIMDYAIEWIAPDGVTPLRHHSSYTGGAVIGTGFEMEDSMMYDMWVGADNIVRYKVNQKYDINKSKNTFTLRITLIDGRVFEYHKEITFVKAGQNGTQGSEWEARIWPTNEEAETAGGVGFERYTEEIRKYPRPLVVNGNFSGTGALTRNDNYQLFLRPFIYKNGKRIEELADADNYSYKVYWDSRYPNVKNTALADRYLASNGSFLEFVKFNGAAETDFGGKSPGVTSPANTPRLQAYTQSVDRVGGSSTDSRTYGAIEVRWRNQNTAGAGATIAGVKYDFVIKAQVDIYMQDELVATIFSYWPVDILFTNGATITPSVFDPNQINTNWPQFVLYNPTGYAPEVEQDYLRFYYGEKAWNEIDPPPFTATPVNQTTTIQSIKPYSLLDPMSWRLYPRAYYFFEECANGAISTDLTTPIDQQGWSSPNPDFEGWQTCTYVRPVVYMLNSYGNTDVNGWDGKSIDLNDERGTLFAPTIGAGYKDPFTNTFSGVIMGIDTSQLKQTYDSIFGGFSADDIKKNPYMTGLFGYQNGVSSFGIMENGTAYFGRADRGGRIIIDGYNAQIYGGLTGSDISGSRDMDMHNRMRLSFIDFEGIAYDEGIADTDNRNSLATDGIRINTGSWSVTDFAQFFVPTTSTIAAQNAGYGSGRGSGTPAIEIGSYKNYMDANPNNKGSDLIRDIKPEETKQWYSAIKNLEIPGRRKFLVTYDGTLYALNAFIKGNIIGSNIIASNFYNSEGNFGMTEDGHMWAGSGYNIFRENFVQDLGTWSATQPTETPDMSVLDILNSSDRRFTSLSPNASAYDVYSQIDGAPFFVANDGRVFCQEIHVSGDSSINIGGFHVLPRLYPGTNGEGAVVSFGTLYLVGPSNGSGTAVEGWGNFYLRGKLVNLGQVFLGSTPEKTISGPNAMNSPFSITPGGAVSTTTGPAFPVSMAAWPLFFYSGQGALTTDANRAWVTLSRGGYAPAFSARPANGKQFLTTSRQTLTLPDNVTWRVDQLGLWSDGIFFTNGAIGDTVAMSYNNNGLGYIGWYQMTGTGSASDGLMLKNLNAGAPNVAIEAPSFVRLSGGRKVGMRGSGSQTSGGVLLESWEGDESSATRKSIIALVPSTNPGNTGASDAANITAGSILLSGKGSARGGVINEIESFIMINGVGLSDSQTVVDENGSVIGNVPTYNTAGRGRIWIRGLGVAIDSAYDSNIVGTANPNNDSTIRVGRSLDGNPNTTPVNAGGYTGSNLPDKGIVNLSGVNIHLHGKIEGGTARLMVSNIEPENQFGVYARFA